MFLLSFDIEFCVKNFKKTQEKFVNTVKKSILQGKELVFE